jgi:peptidoglycan/LPS O-acetylase OafA/YrhL
VAPTSERLDLISRFRRITSGGRYIPEIDGLRFIAIGAVVCYHVAFMTGMDDGANSTQAPTNRIFAFLVAALFNGGRGVEVFFALSGFVLAIPFARERLLGDGRVSLKQYFMRRLTRIEPPYLLSQLIRLYPVMVARSLTFMQILPHFVAGLFYLHLFIYHTAPEVQLVGWSLEIEIQFYLIAPLLALIFFRKSTATRRLLLYGFLIGYWLLVKPIVSANLDAPGAASGLAPYFFNTIAYWIRFFVAGMAVADLYVTLLPRVRVHWLWDVVSIPGWFLFFSIGEEAWYSWGPFLLIILFIGAFKGVVVPWFFRIPIVTVIGGMCYSIYLTHSIGLQTIFRVYMKLFPSIHGFYVRMMIAEVLIVPLLIAVGAAYFVLIERPCMDKDWPKKLAAWTRGRFQKTRATA